ncbi:MAG: hypothetical protein ACJAQT_002099 [Akkermansiaceae bacterium]|jgi:hypothetical protein
MKSMKQIVITLIAGNLWMPFLAKEGKAGPT